MRKIYLYSIMALLALPLMSACSDDNSVDEWTSNYVYIQTDNNLKPRNIKLAHDAGGVHGTIADTLRVRLKHALPTDMNVKLVVSSAEIPSEQIELSESVVTLKAGETVSDKIAVSIPDLTFADDMKDKISMSFSVSINSSTANDVLISETQRTVTWNIVKAAYTNMRAGTPSGSIITDMSSWVIALNPGAEGTPANLIDRKRGTDVAQNDGMFWFTIDFGKVQTLTGLQTQHWSKGYAPREIDIYQSEDGTTWKSQGGIAIGSNTQYVTFITPITTRYLKYAVVKPATNTRTDITEFYAYEPKEQ